MDAASQKEKDIKRWDEMTRLFKLTPDELAQEPNDAQYQRMRYERQIEGMLYVSYLNRGWNREKSAEYARERADYLVINWEKFKTSPDHILQG